MHTRDGCTHAHTFAPDTGIAIPISVGHLTRHIVSVMLRCVAINIDSNLLNNSW